MTKIGSTNTSRQKTKRPSKFRSSWWRGLSSIQPTDPSRRAGSTTDVFVSSLSLSLYVTLFTDPDRGYLPRCSECSESPWYPLKEVEAAWMHVKDMLLLLINATRAADESIRTYVKHDGESGDWLAAAFSASARSVNKTSSDIANEEIALCRMRLQPLPAHKNPLAELMRASSAIPWIALLVRKVLDFCCPRAHVFCG